MSNERPLRSVLSRLRVLMLVALVGSCGAAICVAWHHYRLRASSADEKANLVHSLAESAKAASGRSTPIRVAIFDVGERGGKSTKRLAEILESESTCTWELLSPADIQARALERFHVVIFPGGSGSQQGKALGDEGKQRVREFVRAGGGYVGICGGAFFATAGEDYLTLVNANTLRGEINIPGLGTRSMSARGAGTVKIELTDAGKKVFGNFGGLMDVRFAGGPILWPAERDDLPEYGSLALFRTEIWEYEPQRGTMIDTPAIVAARFGKGRVVAFSPHPEATKGLECLLKRAVFSTARKPAAVNSGA